MIKIVVCGDKDSGKTALRYKYLGERFKPTYIMTIGADFAFKEIPLQKSTLYTEEPVQCQIWDIAGQPLLVHVRALHYQNAHGVLLVYDCTQPATFKSIPTWVDEICKNVKKPIPMVLISNNSDLRETTEFTISSEQERQLADLISTKYLNNQFLVPYIEVSTTTGQNVDYVFESLVEIIVNQLFSQQDHK